jgi:hypothetical protein
MTAAGLGQSLKTDEGGVADGGGDVGMNGHWFSEEGKDD